MNYRYDPNEKQLIVFATPEQHEKVKATLEKLNAGVAASLASPGEVRLKNLERSTAMELFKQILPRVRFSSDEKQNAIVAIATAEDHAVIRSLLDQLEEKPEEEDLKT
ncbi:MAG: hypothetical protein R3C11_18585 [Planctomycetaceae bacterium]